MAYDDYRRSGRDWDERDARNRGWGEDRDFGRSGNAPGYRRDASARDRERNLGYDRPDYDRDEWAGRDREIGRGESGAYGGSYGGYGGYAEYGEPGYGDRYRADRSYGDRGGYGDRSGYGDRGEFRGRGGYEDRDYGYGAGEGYRGRGREDENRDVGRFREVDREIPRGGWDRGRDYGYRGRPADRFDYDRNRGNYESREELDRRSGWGLDRDYGNGEWGRGASRSARRDWDRDRDAW